MAANDYKDPVSWPFLPVPEDGKLAFPALDQSVRDAIRIVLTTRPGEQLMRPRFGAGLQNFLDEGNTVAVRRQIQTVILESLQNYETRIAIDRIKFAIKHADQFGKPCDAMREAGMQLLDALQRLEALDRRFQARSRIAAPHKNGSLAETRG